MSRRDPTIHVTHSSLVEIMNKLAISNRITGAKIADMILEEAYKYQITDRYLDVLKMKTKAKEKAVKSMVADDVPRGTVEKVNLLLVECRMAINSHIKARGIMQNSKDFIMLKEVAKMAYDFTKHFDIRPSEDGLKEYLTIGLSFMGKYGLNKFKTYDSSIYENFESKVEVLQDTHKTETREFYMCWQAEMLKHVSIDEITFLDKDFVKYVHMFYGRREADKHNAPYAIWIEAQFAGLAFVNAIPEINQLYGVNSVKRYGRYINQMIENREAEETQEGDVLSIYKNFDDVEI